MSREILGGVTAPRPRRRVRTLLAGGLLAGVLVVAGATAAQAHDVLRGTDPADGATLTAAPDHVTLTFDQPAQALGTEILVLGPAGETLSDGAAQLVDATVTQALVAYRPAGVYTVEWRVTSADGHPVSGTFSFTATAAVGAPPTPTAVPTVPATQAPAPPQTETPAPTQTPAATPTVAPGAWGHGDNRIHPPLVALLLLLAAIGVGLATWLVTRRDRS